jgi:tRNA(fMet)-specific endonuclease VapC
MRYLLDTNICIYWLKGIQNINSRVVEIDYDSLAVSVITIAELLYGAYNSANIEKNISKVRDFEEAITVIELSRNCIQLYARIKAKLKGEGRIIDDFDILIAATALVNDCILVTNNVKHFERIDNIRLENWMQ